MSNLNEQQFAQHIIETHAPGDRLSKDKSDADVWARKLKVASTIDPNRGGIPVAENGAFREVSLHEHIGLKGVSKPVILQNPQAVPAGERPKVLDGHHRIASAARHGLSVPVDYADSVEQAHEKRKAAEQAARAARRAR